MEKEEKVFIYILTDPRPGELNMYVGRTRRPKKRKTEHLIVNSSESGKSKKCLWIKKMKESGNTPLYDVIDEVPESEFRYWEIWYYELFKSWGFNMTNNESFLGGAKDNYRIWTKELCVEDAKMFKTIKDWRDSFSGGYNAAKKYGWLSECNIYLIRVKKENNYWSKELCLESSQKYNRIIEWMKKCPSAYGAAQRKNWLKECTVHMEHRNITLEECLKDAQKFNTKKDWKKYSISFYFSAYRHRNIGWLEICTKHMNKKNEFKPRGYWTNLRCIEEARKYKTVSEWNKKSSSSYTIACNKGWLKECKLHMKGKQRKPKNYWSLKRCIKDALKYKTITEWLSDSRTAYDAAYKNKWLSECTKHMEHPSKQSEK